MSPSSNTKQTPGEPTSSKMPADSAESSSDWFSFLSANEELIALFDIPCGDLHAAVAPSDNWGDFLPRGQVLQLTENDLQINYRAPLGSGAFCNVFTVFLKHPHTKEFTMGPVALKQLKPKVAGDEAKAKFAIADLRVEAKILSGLGHENVIDLYGVSDKEQVDPLNTFLVMDILGDTLESKLVTWSKKQKKVTPPGVVSVRLREVAFGIAAGMQYLHSERILFRDLKPHNIGFSRVKNEVKIFDFGLAVKLAPGQKCKGKTGTILYMAPEVGSKEGYDFPADVYSFGILLWQMITTKIPFEAELSACTGDASAMLKDIRPPLKYIESKELQSLLESCWAANPEDRPTFTQIRPKLRIIADSSIVLPSKPAPKKKGPPKVRKMLRASMFSR